MNKIKLACLSSILVTGLAQAFTPCNGFEIKVKNNLVDDLLVRKIVLNGAEIQPAGIDRLKSKSEETFTVNNSYANTVMSGELVFNTISLPTKEVTIQFSLANKVLVCSHSDQTQQGELYVNKTRLPGKVRYTIGN